MFLLVKNWFLKIIEMLCSYSSYFFIWSFPRHQKVHNSIYTHCVWWQILYPFRLCGCYVFDFSFLRDFVTWWSPKSKTRPDQGNVQTKEERSGKTDGRTCATHSCQSSSSVEGLRPSVQPAAAAAARRARRGRPENTCAAAAATAPGNGMCSQLAPAGAPLHWVCSSSLSTVVVGARAKGGGTEQSNCTGPSAIAIDSPCGRPAIVLTEISKIISAARSLLVLRRALAACSSTRTAAVGHGEGGASTACTARVCSVVCCLWRLSPGESKESGAISCCQWWRRVLMSWLMSEFVMIISGKNKENQILMTHVAYIHPVNTPICTAQMPCFFLSRPSFRILQLLIWKS